MPEERAACLRRAAAPVAASVALHLVLTGGVASILFGGLPGHIADGEAPLVVEIVAGEGRSQEPTPARPLARGRSRPAAPPPVPHPAAAAEAVPAPPEPVAALAEAPAPAGEEASGSPFSAHEAGSSDVGPDRDLVTAGGEPPSGPEPVHSLVAMDPEAPARAPMIPAPPPVEAERSDAAHARARLDSVTRNPSLSARAELQPFVGRRDVFEFLLDHPDFATHITRALRLARYRIWRTDDGMFIDDGWGATGQLTVVHAATGTRVLYAKGEFQHKLLPTIPGEAVVTINYDAWPSADGRELVHARISGQLKIDSALATLVLKVASSVAAEKAEKESQRLIRTFASVLRAIDETPAAVYATLQGRADVPRLELEQFRALLRLP